MAVTSALVLLAVVWFMTLFVVMPIGMHTQGDAGEKVRGTHDGAPVHINWKRKLTITTLAALAVWAVLVAPMVQSRWTAV